MKKAFIRFLKRIVYRLRSDLTTEDLIAREWL